MMNILEAPDLERRARIGEGSAHVLVQLARRAASACGAALLALFVPKCPLCVAAYLVALGVGAGNAQAAAPFVRPVAFTLASGATLALAIGAWRLLRRRTERACCQPLLNSRRAVPRSSAARG